MTATAANDPSLAAEPPITVHIRPLLSAIPATGLPIDPLRITRAGHPR